ncbi:DUF927 domain-containing protein [Vogesella sp. XCS3]|uniref:DUF927 domain-containing protein n=1 Tax=Vogesella sp. XCS3 TaxID=2877939 RepID=UPI001D0AC654|nr:DUF927 domain-containing protein [Vogesella sp. XCS3]UDM17943.1 DUF927 domain-containing protein [Vogesella sp. XCS3]
MNVPLRAPGDDIRAALAYLDAHDRDKWVMHGMAVKSELGEAGFPIWDDWSRTADNYQPKAARSVWKSIKPAGRITIASLFAEAIQHGYRPTAPYQPPSPEERAKIEADQQAAQAEAEALAQQQRDVARQQAANLWGRGHAVSSEHTYLQAKGIQPKGAAQLRDMLLIPLRDGGELVNLQIIGADGGKRFLTGGQVKGASLVLGQIKGADTVLLCEGWATGCTLHQATGLPVVVAFNAHNLVTIAGRLASALPVDVQVLVCGDTDESLTGQKAASRAAELLQGRGRSMVPVFTQEQIEQYRQQHGKAPSDYNDLHQLAGLLAVTEAVQAPANPEKNTDLYMSGYVSMANEREGTPLPAVGDADLPKIDGNYGNHGNLHQESSTGETSSDIGRLPLPENENGNHGNTQGLPPGFLLIYGSHRPGVYWLDPEGERPPRWICSPLSVEAKTRDERGSNWGRLLYWDDAEGRPHRWAMPAELTCGDGSEMAKELARGGLDIDPTRKARELLNAYLVRCTPPRFVRCTSRTGWHGGAFVLHDDVVSQQDGEGIFLQSERDETMGMVQAGTAAGWRELVAKLAAGNSRLVFALSLAFAAPLAELANESGGFHLIGTSSAGKSTALEAAASVWGSPADYGYKWRATSNGLEGLCASRNDLLVILDELAQVDPREAGESAYLIANGQGKARASRNGTMRTPARWRVLLLSAGEISLTQHMQEAGKQSRAGQEIRLIDIAAESGAGLGLFDTLHGMESGAALSQAIKAACQQQHGTAGRAFLQQLVQQCDAVATLIRDARASFLAEDVPPSASGQVVRAASRFALVAVAGEIATTWGLTGWQEGEAMAAAVRLFNEWLSGRGGAGDAETREGLAAVRAFLEAHGESRFTPWDANPAATACTINRAGFKRLEDDGLWFYVLPAAFRKEICKGFNPVSVAKSMAGRGWLKTQSDDRTTYKAKLPGMGNKPSNVYLITPGIWEDEQ